MLLENHNDKSLDKYLDYVKKDLDLLYVSKTTSRQRFNLESFVLNYKITISSKYGLNIFLVLDYKVEDLEENFGDILDVYENFSREVSLELARLKLDSFDVNYHTYFPRIDPGYFEENIFSKTDENSIADALKEAIGSSFSSINSTMKLKSVFKRNNPNKKGNLSLKRNDLQLSIKGIFTHETSPDLSLKKDMTLEKESNAIIDNIYERFELDEDQKNILYNHNSGHRLLLAEAGTGKSVILFLKAQRIASLNPDCRILILAYNNYLVHEFKQKKIYENIKGSYIDIFTYDKFVNTLVSEYLSTKEYEKFDKDSKTEDLLNVIENVKKYEAIYIDEIQQFKPLWIRFCYSMLNSHEEENHSFVLCGDVNQATRNGKRNRWREAGLPPFTGRRMTLTKKFRATDEINDFVDGFVKNLYTFTARNEMEIIEEIKSDSLYSIEVHDDGQLHDLTEYANNDVMFFKTSYRLEDRLTEIVHFVKHIRNEIDLRDTVIMYYGSRTMYNTDFGEELRDLLTKEGIDVEMEDEENFLRYDSLKDSLAIVSVQKCIGLDFKNVILILLDKYGYDYENKIKMHYEENLDGFDLDILNKDISNLYVSLTRAKKKLFIENSSSFGRVKIFHSLIFGD